jgi:hypothetical protein
MRMARRSWAIRGIASIAIALLVPAAFGAELTVDPTSLLPVTTAPWREYSWQFPHRSPIGLPPMGSEAAASALLSPSPSIPSASLQIELSAQELELQPAPVPVPGPLWLLVSGAAALLAGLRPRKMLVSPTHECEVSRE